MTLDIADLLDLSQTQHDGLFKGRQFPWEILPEIGGYMKAKLEPAIHGKVSPQAVIEGDVFIGEGTVVEPNVYIKGPVWIGKNCQVRQGAYVRGDVIAGDDCVLGNSCEFKNCFLFNGVKVPHFSYVGDSVLGHLVHLGAGVTLSNLKVTPGKIQVDLGSRKLDTGLRKFGAVLGDHAEVGCHSVLNPGSVIGRQTVIYPGVIWRGYCPPSSMVKLKQEQLIVPRR